MAMPFEASEFLSLGFERRGYDRYRGIKDASQRSKFCSLFGTTCEVIALIWKDLRLSDDPLIRIDKYTKPIHLLLVYRWMKRYESEVELETDFEISVKSIRKWCEILTAKIALLRKMKIDPNWQDDNSLQMCHTVDGVHYLHEEPRPFSTMSSSFKFGGKAGLVYEICLCTHKNKISWVNGPFLAGNDDLTVFKTKGLWDAIKRKQQDRADTNIRVIADDGYFDKKLISSLAYRNEFDPRGIAYFKDRALARHETVNGRSKNFHCLQAKFRHDRGVHPNGDYSFPRHKACVEAIFVTLQYEMDIGKFALFDPYP